MATLIGTRPFSDNPEDTFNIVILDVIYTFKTQRNTLGFWTLSLYNQDGDAIVLGVKIVAGSFILEPYPSLLFDIYVPGEIDPDRDNLSDYQMEVWEK